MLCGRCLNECRVARLRIEGVGRRVNTACLDYKERTFTSVNVAWCMHTYVTSVTIATHENEYHCLEQVFEKSSLEASVEEKWSEPALVLLLMGVYRML